MPLRSTFDDEEIAYLRSGGRRLARLATVDAEGWPHVVPVGWAYNAELGTIDVGGHELGRTKKFRNVRATERGAIVVDDLASVSPWRPRMVMVQGRAEALDDEPGRPAVIRIWPERIASQGLGAER